MKKLQIYFDHLKMSNLLVDCTGAGVTINSKGLSLNDIDSVFINKNGDVMHGNLNMNSNKILDVPQPIENQDVANKEYVDKEINVIKHIFSTEIKPSIMKFISDQDVLKKDIQEIQNSLSIIKSIRIDLQISSDYRGNIYTKNEYYKIKKTGTLTLYLANRTIHRQMVNNLLSPTRTILSVHELVNRDSEWEQKIYPDFLTVGHKLLFHNINNLVGTFNIVYLEQKNNTEINPTNYLSIQQNTFDLL